MFLGFLRVCFILPLKEGSSDTQSRSNKVVLDHKVAGALSQSAQRLKLSAEDSARINGLERLILSTLKCVVGVIVDFCIFFFEQKTKTTLFFRLSIFSLLHDDRDDGK